MTHEDDKHFSYLIDESTKLTDQYAKEKENFYRSIYETAISSRNDTIASLSTGKQFELPKLENKDAYEQIVLPQLDRLKELSSKLNALNAEEQLVLITDHLEEYKQKTVDFCRSIQHQFTTSQLVNGADNLDQFKQIIKLFHNLKARLDDLRTNRISRSDELNEIASEIALKKRSKEVELEGIDFDPLIDDLVEKFVRPEIADFNRKQSEIPLKLNSIIKKTKTNVRPFNDFLSKKHTDELSAFTGKQTKLLDDFKRSFQFDIDYEDEHGVFSAFLKSIKLNLDTFRAKVSKAIDECVEQSTAERNSLNDELFTGIAKLVITTLSKEPNQMKTFDGPKELKEENLKLNLQRRIEFYRAAVLLKKQKDAMKADYKPTDLGTTKKVKNKANKDNLNTDLKDGVPVKELVKLTRKKKSRDVTKKEHTKDKESLKEIVQRMLRDRCERIEPNNGDDKCNVKKKVKKKKK